MVVLKFGGSSVASAAAVARVCDIVARERRPRAVVVSAIGGVTDQLIDAARLAGAGEGAGAARVLAAVRARHREAGGAIAVPARRRALMAELDTLWREAEALADACAAAQTCSPASRDALVATGELASSRLVAACLAERGVSAVWIDARRVVVTDGRHGGAAPDPAATRERVRADVRSRVRCREVPVLGGFIGATSAGAVTTLGRGGSDYSASLVGACLDADEIQIWTDTDGVLTADPRTLPQAQTVPRLSYAEAAALAAAGAKVLHPATVAPAARAGIPVRVLNSRRPEAAGTLITTGQGDRARPLAGLAWKTGRRQGFTDVTVVGDALAWNARLRDLVLQAAGPARLQLAAGATGACHLTLIVADRNAGSVIASLHAGLFERQDEQPAAAADAAYQSPDPRPAAGQEAWA